MPSNMIRTAPPDAKDLIRVLARAISKDVKDVVPQVGVVLSVGGCVMACAGLVRYEKVSSEEIAAKSAEAESKRMAAREAAMAMAAEDTPTQRARPTAGGRGPSGAALDPQLGATGPWRPTTSTSTRRSTSAGSP